MHAELIFLFHQVLLQLMDEIDNEGLLKSLELFVDRFPEQTAHYSVGVADKLVCLARFLSCHKQDSK